MAYADGLCRYLSISGFKEVSAVDKLISIIAISDGQPMKQYEMTGDTSNRLRTPHYIDIFNKLFGKEKGEIVIYLHRLLTMPENKLIQILSYTDDVNEEKAIDSEDFSREDIQAHMEISSFFKNYFGMNHEEVEWTIGMVRLSLGDLTALPYILKELGTSSQLSLVYQSMFSDEYEKTLLFRSKLED